METKKCFCCNKEVSNDVQICPKCGAMLPIEIDPITYEKNKKTLKWSAIVGLIVGFFSTILLGGIDPNSYLFLLGIVLGFGSAFLTEFCIKKYYKKKDAERISIDIQCSQSRAHRWLVQEQIDREFLNKNDTIANQMLSAVSAINAMWATDSCLYKGNENSKFRSELYLLALTPELFLNNYFLFKAGDHDDIKDSIYTERPYLVIETLIKMGLFIFETGNHIYVLKLIVKGDRPEYQGHKDIAAKILSKEENQ